MNKKYVIVSLVLACALILSTGVALAGKNPPEQPSATLLVSGLDGATGSTIGPDGALYVTEGAAGRVSRVDPQTGEKTTFASGLPTRVIDFYIGGAVDVAFLDGTAYVLVTLVGPDLGGHSIVGIYRMDGPDSFTAIADIGQWSIDNPPPPTTTYDVPTGVQFALEPYRGGFLVTDGHHNRVLFVTLDGEISQLIQFDNVVPTGLETWGSKVLVSQVGPVPHLPETGKVVMFKPMKSHTAKEIGSGAPLLIDVEFGRGHKLYALSQGDYSGGIEGDPALPNTGAIVRVNKDGTFTEIVDKLNRPTSFEFIGDSAFVVTLGVEIWRIDGIPGPSSGK